MFVAAITLSQSYWVFRKLIYKWKWYQQASQLQDGPSSHPINMWGVGELEEEVDPRRRKWIVQCNPEELGKRMKEEVTRMELNPEE